MNSVPEFNHTVDILMEKLRKNANGKTSIELHKELSGVALDVISQVILIYNFNANVGNLGKDLAK
jgi:hypothetical protein